MESHQRRRGGSLARRWSPIVVVLAFVTGPLLATRAVGADAFLRVVATSPGRVTASGSPPVLIRFTAPVAPTSPLPTLSPSVPGSWKRVVRQLVFTPTGAWPPDSTVTVTVPGGSGGIVGTDGSTLRKDRTFSFYVGDGSLLRAQQLLAKLNYLPVTWTQTSPATPGAAADERAAFDPPRGRFTYIGQAPTQLEALWKPGVAGRVWTSALGTFENDNNLPISGTLSGPVWQALLTEARHPAAHRSRTGFTFAVANQTSPETLTIWRGGTVVLNTLANTGISLAPTQDGLFAVYAKLRTQVMRGTDPDGQPYADPVSWISYFNGSDAVHYFDRASFGYPQSLGCVEVPLVPAEQAYGYLQIGTLISVIN
jgi:hypothetical protein